MTYDELLAEINRLDNESLDSYGIPALRAVVKLHKPQTVPYVDYCDHCVSELYPCSTIKAIEWELQ